MKKYLLAILLLSIVPSIGSAQHSIPLAAKPIEWYNSIYLEVLFKGFYRTHELNTKTQETKDSFFTVFTPLILNLVPSRSGYFHTIQDDSVTLGFQNTDVDGRKYDISIGFHLDPSAMRISKFAFLGTTKFAEPGVISNTEETLFLADTVMREQNDGELYQEFATLEDVISRTDSGYESSDTMISTYRFDPAASTFHMAIVKLFHTEPLNGVGQVTKSTFSIFPNPSSDVLNITLPQEMEGPFTITFFDQLGRVVKSRTVHHATAITEDVWDLPEGVYIATVRSQIGFHSQRIVIQH